MSPRRSFSHFPVHLTLLLLSGSEDGQGKHSPLLYVQYRSGASSSSLWAQKQEQRGIIDGLEAVALVRLTQSLGLRQLRQSPFDVPLSSVVCALLRLLLIGGGGFRLREKNEILSFYYWPRVCVLLQEYGLSLRLFIHHVLDSTQLLLLLRAIFRSVVASLATPPY